MKICMVASVTDTPHYIIQSFTIPWIDQTFNVFEDEGFRSGLIEKTDRIIPELTTIIMKAQISARDRPALARHSSREKIVRWK